MQGCRIAGGQCLQRADGKEVVVAKPNYQFEKRRRELDKQRKKEEKRLRKLADRQGKPEGEEDAYNPAPAANEQPEGSV